MLDTTFEACVIPLHKLFLIEVFADQFVVYICFVVINLSCFNCQLHCLGSVKESVFGSKKPLYTCFSNRWLPGNFRPQVNNIMMASSAHHIS